MYYREHMRSLRQELEAAGAFEMRESLIWTKVAILCALLVAFFAAHLLLPLWASVLLIPFTALATAGISMVGHEGSHRSACRTARRNDVLHWVTFPLFSGISALYWTHKHNVMHHGHPNTVGMDPDIGIWPLALCRKDHERSGPVRRFIQRHMQGALFWPISFFLVYEMRVEGVRHVIARAKKTGVDGHIVADVAGMLLHYVIWLVLPALVLPLWPLVGFYLAIWAFEGFYLAAIFVPAHMGLPIVDKSDDLMLLTLKTGRNFHVPKLVSWWMVGLDCQIEHHLFPKITDSALHIARPIVRDFARRHGLPYHEASFPVCIADATRFFARAWSEDPVDVVAPT